MYKQTTVRDFFEATYRPQRLLAAREASIVEYRTTLNRMQACFTRDLYLSELDDEHVAEFLSWLRDLGRANDTLEKHRGNLQALANFASRRRLIHDPLMLDKIRKVKRQPLAWSEADMHRILEAAAAIEGMVGEIPAGLWWEALMTVMLFCGVRVGACLRLKWQDVNLAERWALFTSETQKQWADQRIAFSDFAAQRLAVIRLPVRELVFPWPYDQRQRNKQTLRRSLTRSILKPLGLPTDRFSKFHRVRRTTATLVADQVSDEEASRLLGHSSVQITRQRYIDRTKLRLRRPCDQMAEPTYRRLNLGG